jgi:septum site-determining protein MinD
MGRIISVVSGKGGVGKSTVALNLASALCSHYGRKVALVDLNLTTPHLAAMTGIAPRSLTLEDLLEGRASLCETLQPRAGIHLLPGSLSPKKLAGERLGRLGPVLRALRQNYDEVIIDAGPGLGKEAMLALRYGDELLYVSTPTVPALIDVIRSRRAVGKLGKTHLGLVLNMVAADEAQLSRQQASAMAGLPVIASIPRDQAVPKSLAAETPLTHFDQGSPACRAFLMLGADLCGKEYSPPDRLAGRQKTGLLGRILKLFR